MSGTSGLMVVAKSEHAYTVLKRAFKEREVEKIYHAVVQGHPDPLAGTIDAPIGRHPTHSWKFAVTPEGKDSITHYETLEAFPRASLLEIHLETGRTHQIRVHMAAHRHPCVGDPLYGGDPTLAARLGLTRQWLHAHQLSFAHPRTGDWVTFTSPYPPDLAARPRGAARRVSAGRRRILRARNACSTTFHVRSCGSTCADRDCGQRPPSKRAGSSSGRAAAMRRRVSESIVAGSASRSYQPTSVISPSAGCGSPDTQLHRKVRSR